MWELGNKKYFVVLSCILQQFQEPSLFAMSQGIFIHKVTAVNIISNVQKITGGRVKGVNITINSPVILGLENSDIIANAFQGS